eukprot:10011132-Lingulodinium_polyedra.AAC.1
MGHAGPAIEHYCFDRLGITVLERYFRQSHQHGAEHYGHLARGATTHDLLKKTEYVVVTPCADHDARNAFRWTLHNQVKDKEVARDCYIAIEALR